MAVRLTVKVPGGSVRLVGDHLQALGPMVVQRPKVIAADERQQPLVLDGLIVEALILSPDQVIDGMVGQEVPSPGEAVRKESVSQVAPAPLAVVPDVGSSDDAPAQKASRKMVGR